MDFKLEVIDPQTDEFASYAHRLRDFQKRRDTWLQDVNYRVRAAQSVNFLVDDEMKADAAVVSEMLTEEYEFIHLDTSESMFCC